MSGSKKQAIEGALSLPVDKISIINLVDDLIEYSHEVGASDIHVQPSEDKITIRLRIDGIMHDSFLFPKEIIEEIITRIKVLSNLRTDEHQAAQDGRFRVTLKDLQDHKKIRFDIRVSIIPTYYGENAVLRLLAEQAQVFVLENLGFSPRDQGIIKKAIRKPYGMILATGPTGCGKTTTLYTILKTLNTKEVTIITIEDPIEYSIEGIDQIQVNLRTGLTFATGLRSILRQDPNIIMVGEIRDEDAAKIAVNAALTGHLLLSTLHTNTAATALPRLMDMGIQPFLVASTVNVVIAQRLVRIICPKCKIKKVLTEIETKSLAEALGKIKKEELTKTFFMGKGCKECNYAGYRGRIGIYEVLEVNDEIRDLIMKRANANTIEEVAIKNGMTTMLEDGFKKVLDGITSIEEVLRVIHE